MSTDKVVVSDTVRITVKFKDIDANGNEVELSPVTNPQVVIKNSSQAIVVSDTSSQISSSIFYFDYTPTIADTYTVKFTGILANSNTVVVEQRLYVSSTVEEYQPTIILKNDETITFAADVTPLYIDPDQLLPYFPDASALEIGEIIHNQCIEIKSIYKLLDSDDGSSLSFIAQEYIKAASACELSRTYGYGGDDEVSLQLGDLHVTNKTIPRNKVTRDNATTWCQIAAALRKEMLANRVGPLGFQMKGLPTVGPVYSGGKMPQGDGGKVAYLTDRELYGPVRTVPAQQDPMPSRGLRSRD
jgi:hypothetical protein